MSMTTKKMVQYKRTMNIFQNAMGCDSPDSLQHFSPQIHICAYGQDSHKNTIPLTFFTLTMEDMLSAIFLTSFVA